MRWLYRRRERCGGGGDCNDADVDFVGDDGEEEDELIIAINMTMPPSSLPPFPNPTSPSYPSLPLTACACHQQLLSKRVSMGKNMDAISALPDTK